MELNSGAALWWRDVRKSKNEEWRSVRLQENLISRNFPSYLCVNPALAFPKPQG